MMTMKQLSDYYLGLDIGTDSVGWAVTDTEYNISKFNGNATWGIRLFDESKTAEERRMFRSSRRRLQRKRERLALLEMLFDEEISKKDITFFHRLKESSLYLEDKSTGVKYTVFNDNDFSDKDYYKKYPTIYHLRYDLINNKEAHDIRLVFLALHHLIKNRGHFLFDSLKVEDIGDFSLIYDEFVSYLNDNYDIILNCVDKNKFSEILKDRNCTKTKKIYEIAELFGINKKENVQEYAILSLLAGSSVDLYKVFDDESLKDAEKNKVTFSSGFEDSESDYQSILGERFELLEVIKAVYDWAVLADILGGQEYISGAKVAVYDKHRSDLKLLKKYVKLYLPEKYNEIFKVTKAANNYVAYSGHIKKNGRTGVLNGKRCSQEDFCKYLSKLLGNCKSGEYAEMFAEIKNATFMPKQTSKDNGVVPMQVHERELKSILANAESYLPFLNNKDENGLSVSDKIIALFEYRIPYYVGPLNTHSKRAWLVRSDDKIYPWNIKEVVDMDKTAEEFINNLTSKCTYLPEKDVIPKNSLLYSKFKVLNELNNLKLDGQGISVELKQDIYSELFLKYNKVTNKKLRSYLTSRAIEFESITGIDGDFKSNLKSYRDLQGYDLSNYEKEEVIKSITIFGDDKRLLKKRLKKQLGNRLSEEEINKISKLKYSGWSKLSKEFLSDVECTYKVTGELVTVISAMWQTNDNLMQLLYSDNYAPSFTEKINELNRFDEGKSLKEMVESLYVSPKVKRPIYQSLLIAKEIEKIYKQPPKKIFVEVARGEEKKERKVSRKQRLLDLYKDCKKENADLYDALLGEEEDRLRSDKLYFYYAQLGKDMYSGKPIDLDNLMGANSIYDIDHIFPRSKVKDDSLDNRVLVNKTINANKTNEYPLSQDIRDKMAGFWNVLKSKDLISDKKYERLTRAYPLKDEELAAFISRQLVETRQSTKAVAQILEQLYPKPQTEIVYVKAALVSDFRRQFDLLKCRAVNDYHHAKDAYLNVVVGNLYNVKFTHNKVNFIAGLQQSGAKGFSLNKMYDYDTPNAWSKEKSLEIVKNTMAKNNIRYTRYSFKQKGGLFDQLLVKKGSGQVPIKANGAISNTEKYGAYNRPSSTYFALAEYADKKGKKIRQIVPINAYQEMEYINNPDAYISAIVGFDAKVIIPCIKYNSCLSFNGFRMHLSSKSGGGSTLVYKPAVQLVLGYESEKYIRNIVKYLEQFSSREINRFDCLTKEQNIAVYNQIVLKLTTTVFSWKFGALGEKLKDKTEMFENLSVEKQCYVINEILKIVHCNVLSGDLTYLSESKKSGISTTNSKVSDIKNITSVKLINQSVTGLFENEVDFLN